ncbi:MAG TPA: 50S ribosomal protein L25 [Terriglobales bacterium]|nr:50S ribosomal protein L25 [Terriglobales bacterium]
MPTTEAIGVVEAQPRAQERGKNVARRLRRSGRVPAVLYGAKKDSVAVSLDPKQVARILHSESGHNTIFDLQVGPERTKAMIVDWQLEPVKGGLLHVDLKRIAMDERIKVKVPIHLKGEAAGVKTQGGVLEQLLREVEVECLPSDIPGHIEVDVTELVFGKVVRVSELPRSEKIKFLTDAHYPVAHVISIKEEEVAAPVEAGVEAAPAEPEVIKKGKQEVGEEGAAEAEAAAPAEKKAEKPEKGKEKK